MSKGSPHRIPSLRSCESCGVATGIRARGDVVETRMGLGIDQRIEEPERPLLI